MKWTSAQVVSAFLLFLTAGPVQAQIRIDRGRDGAITLFGAAESDTQIGVTARDLSASEADRLKVDGGVYIESVVPDSPAAKAGLKVADVVTEFDGERVRSLQQFTRLVRESSPDRSLHLKYQRDGRSSDISITPASRSTWAPPLRGLPPLSTWPPALAGAAPGVFGNRRGAQLGVTVQELTPELAAYFGAKDGVLVSSVVEDSPAFRAGIKVGDVITSSNGRTVFEVSDLTRDLNAISGAGDLTLVIVRDKKEMTIKATIDAQTGRGVSPMRPRGHSGIL